MVRRSSAARAANAPSTCCSSLPIAGAPGRLPRLPARLRHRAQPARHAGLRPHELRRARPLRARDPRRRRVPPEPAEHASCSPAWRSCCRPGSGLVLAVLVADTKRGRTFFQFVFFAPFVLAPVAVGAVWKFLYAPYFGVVATVGSALGLDTADGRAARGRRHGAVGDHGRVPVAVRRLQHGRLPRGDPGRSRASTTSTPSWRAPAGSSSSGGSRGRCCGHRRSRWSC